MRIFKAATFVALAFLCTTTFAQKDLFTRGAVVNLDTTEAGGYGEIVSGLDLDRDGKLEIYAVNDNWGDGSSGKYPQEMIPKIFKYENNNGKWEVVWQATLDIPAQNTWPTLTSADLDGDGKGEIVWGPVNATSDANPNPARIVVFESKGDGSDVMGVDDGSGKYLPNAKWSIVSEDKINLRPFKWLANDIDNDGKQELLLADRQGSGYGMQFGVISVSDIPDAGDGSETWTIEFDGKNVTPHFARIAEIKAPANAPGGFGNIISGVDFDGDGLKEIYAINQNWSDGAEELIPRAYKYEWNGSYWDLVWEATLDIVPKQNTWPALTYGDWDKDGKSEIIWGPVNFLGDDNVNPARIVVFEAAGDGTDVMGVDDGNGNYKPNASFTIVSEFEGKVEVRPIKWVLEDIDGDNAEELIFADRNGAAYNYGIISVDNIPDNGDESETWTVEASGTTVAVDNGSKWDIAVVGNTAYLFDGAGKLFPVKWNGTAYEATKAFTPFPGGSFKGSVVVDIDNDGNKEIVVGAWGTSGNGAVYLLQPDADTLAATKIADCSSLGVTRFNGADAGDIDGDGNIDFVFGTREKSSTPNNSIVRVAYKGGDIADAANYEASIIDQELMGATGGQLDIVSIGNLDGDDAMEIVYSGVHRNLSETIPMAILDYQDAMSPASGSSAAHRWDIAVLDNAAYLFANDMSVQGVKFVNGAWQVMPKLTGIAGGFGSFKGSVVTDIDGDGTKEIVVGGWAAGNKGGVYLLQPMNGGLKSTKIADLSELGADRLNGAAAGDIDQDGYMDLVFGSRSNDGAIYRVEYKGGDIADIASYSTQLVDKEILPGAGQTDIVNIANVDSDPELEVIYSGIPRGTYPVATPMVILDVQKINFTPIADARVDADGDFIPDNLNNEYTIAGVVTTINFTASSNNLSIYIQDETAGINVYGYKDDSTSVNIGDRIMVKGLIKQFNGLTEITPSEPITVMGQATVPAPIELTAKAFLESPESYEGSLVKILGIASTTEWPDTNSEKNMTFTDGINELTVRVDKDTDIDGQPEPTYPVNVTGVVAQYTKATTKDDGYQVMPSAYTDFEQGVAVDPHPEFYFTDATKTELDGKTITITDPTEEYKLFWHPAVIVGDASLIYQIYALDTEGTEIWLKGSDDGNKDTVKTIVGSELVKLITDKGADNKLDVKVGLRTKASTSKNIIASVDTISFTLVNNTVGVEDAEDMIPEKFYVAQNYPNPFNPTTTIKFGLTENAKVSLKIYNVLGQEVAVLINNQTLNAGHHFKAFNASRLASGTYIYRLTAGKNVTVKKMLLVK